MKKLFTLFAAMMLTGSMFATVYNAELITTAAGLEDGGLYIFERNAHVLINSTGGGTTYKLQTTDTYSKVGLSGGERYIWTLEEQPTDSFKIISNAEENSGHIELNNQSGKTNITLANAGAGGVWKITFDSDGNALITTYNAGYAESGRDRFLGETEANSNEYRAYSVASSLSSNGHDFKVYKLAESTSPYIVASPASVDFGTKVQDATIDPVEIEVQFGNLTGAVSYSGLTAPFSVSGSIAASGDKLTISVDASSVIEANQTLTISSAADSKSIDIPVKVKIIEAADPSAAFVLFSGDLVEGDYVIYDAGGAMNTTLDADRLQITNVTPENNMISSPDASIVWHIAPSDSYWTIYNADAAKYAAGTEVKNKIQLLADGTDDKALWTASNTSGSYTFVNKANAAKSVNATLKRNGTYGWACYASGSVTLYKKGGGGATALDDAAVEHKAVKRIENGQIIIIRDGKRYNLVGARVE